MFQNDDKLNLFTFTSNLQWNLGLLISESQGKENASFFRVGALGGTQANASCVDARE